jgi:hypothetical protein
LHSTAELFPRILNAPDKFTRLRKGCQDPQRHRIWENIMKWNIGILERWAGRKIRETLRNDMGEWRMGNLTKRGKSNLTPYA